MPKTAAPTPLPTDWHKLDRPTQRAILKGLLTAHPDHPLTGTDLRKLHRPEITAAIRELTTPAPDAE